MREKERCTVSWDYCCLICFHFSAVGSVACTVRTSGNDLEVFCRSFLWVFFSLSLKILRSFIHSFSLSHTNIQIRFFGLVHSLSPFCFSQMSLVCVSAGVLSTVVRINKVSYKRQWACEHYRSLQLHRLVMTFMRATVFSHDWSTISRLLVFCFHVQLCSLCWSAITSITDHVHSLHTQGSFFYSRRLLIV